MAHIYISIVSHGNDEDIITNANLREINSLDNTIVIIRDNISSSVLKSYCIENGFSYSASKATLGFGANNNINFKVALSLGMKKTDWFILFNPDLNISSSMIKRLVSTLPEFSNQIFAINLYFDEQFSVMENSLRKFPTFQSFFNLFKRTSLTQTYDKKSLANGAFVDWAAASFLVFKAGLYKKLNGFDESYFMYYEDVDICYRANKVYGQQVCYLKNIKAVHQGGYKNRKLFSQHFRWYFISLIRFLLKSTFGTKK